MLHELEHQVESQGGKFEDYLKSLNKSKDQLTLDLLPEAIKRVKVSLLIREISQVEKISVSEEELSKQLEELKNTYKENKEMQEQLKNPDYRAYLMNTMTSRKMIEKLKEWNVV
jgi:trigger factor